ncbi:alpha/beta hydrolase [Streptomyces sp. NPDC050388]|uniref:alpha/beta fold hydrolase n=1 Tax=Streptomyces sp. NPDC050388 TaxID=3155781 RepID=UPI003424C5FD
MHIGHIEVEPGVRLHVQDLGEGEPVVLLPGFGMAHETWDGVVRRLTESGYRAVCVDPRGHGLSDRPLHGYEVPRLAKDVVAVLDALGIDSATIVGWSFSGQVGFQLAATAPERVSQLVLVCSNAVRTTRSEEFPFGLPASTLLPTLLEGELNDRMTSRRAGIANAFASPPDPHLLEWLTTLSLRMPSWAGAAVCVALMETDLVAQIPHVRQPVLQLIGADDKIFSLKGARWLNERLTDATLIPLERCGHYPMLEQPTVFFDALHAFLSRTDPRPAEQGTVG